MITIIASVFVFGILVLFHELGHFFLAKATGMRVDEFAIGFGPRIYSKQVGETEYSVRSVPLGGFNDIAGMTQEENDAGDRGYCEKPVWKRMLVILAGPLMNFFLAFLIFFALFLSVGVSTPSTRPELGEVLPGKPAAAAGLRAGDVIRTMDGEAVAAWEDIVRIILAKAERPIKIELMRGDEIVRTTLIPVFDKSANRPMVGITSASDFHQPGVFEAFGLAAEKTVYVVYRMIAGLREMIFGSASAELAGPLGVAQMAGEVAQIGMAALLNFAALISLNLGIINLLPVPALDGGHVFTLLIEALRGKPLGEKALRYSQIAGISLLVTIMLVATKNDVVRIFINN